MYEFDKIINIGKFTIAVDSVAQYGYFEHDTYGDEFGGGLWFDDDGCLDDYDGVCELPDEVVKGIKDLGYKI